jgi:hypothetical protein
MQTFSASYVHGTTKTGSENRKADQIQRKTVRYLHILFGENVSRWWKLSISVEHQKEKKGERKQFSRSIITIQISK